MLSVLLGNIANIGIFGVINMWHYSVDINSLIDNWNYRVFPTIEEAMEFAKLAVQNGLTASIKRMKPQTD